MIFLSLNQRKTLAELPGESFTLESSHVTAGHVVVSAWDKEGHARIIEIAPDGRRSERKASFLG